MALQCSSAMRIASSRHHLAFSSPVRISRRNVRAYVDPSDQGSGSTMPEQNITQPSTPATGGPAAPAKPNQGAGIAAGAVLAAVAAFAASDLVTSGPSLASLEAMSIPLDVALHNGKPTVLEFYADWCEVCRELVPYEYEVQKQYGDKVNFVMLNVENTKWAQEAADYRVGGIPHFVFFNAEGDALAAAVGRLPPQVLEGNVSALAEGSSNLPYAAVKERTSSLTPPDSKPAPRQAAPRDHA